MIQGGGKEVDAMVFQFYKLMRWPICSAGLIINCDFEVRPELLSPCYLCLCDKVATTLDVCVAEV